MLYQLGEILREAEHRWLRPAEISEILRNYQRFELTPDPPVRPPGNLLAVAYFLLYEAYYVDFSFSVMPKARESIFPSGGTSI
ncbi:hypothetical protein Ahy_A09g043553 [Arachis hypogaea]|uniref:CG-1 domain-containing protein n=1 Tax=Arachis hypogaea TaxID=3818 RepID=A0A445BIK9_ARAHY|nr:hypothetical protein Ahy_A09g043553 [Arachis hypogaea]